MLSDLPRRRYVGFVKSACKMYVYYIFLFNVILLSTDIYMYLYLPAIPVGAFLFLQVL